MINLGAVSGTVSVMATNSSSGTILFSKTYAITNVQISSNEAKFVLNVPVSPYPLSADISVMQKGGVWSASVIVTRQLDIDANGTVDISDASVVGNAWSTSIGSFNYNPRADLNASGKVDIIDVSIFGAYWQSTDFR